MSKLMLFVCVLLTLPMLAFATTAPTYFDQLQTRYQAAGPATYDDLKSMWSGRCFERVAPSMPLNAGLVTIERQAGDAGPQFPTPAPLQFAAIATYRNVQGISTPANYFDHYNPAFDNSVYLSVLPATQSGQITQTDFSSGTVSWALDFEPNGQPDLSFAVRKDAQGLVVESSNLVPKNTIHSDSLGKYMSPVAVGVWDYCYFFKKLQ